MSAGVGDAAAMHDDAAAVRAHIVREALTMSLYMAIVLLAVLAGAEPRVADVEERLALLVPGTAVGLLLAHVFAFSLSHVAIAEAGSVARGERLETILAMVAGAMAVLVVAELPLLLIDDDARAATWSSILLVGVIGATAWFASRSSGGSRRRSLGYAAFIVVAALVVVVLKTTLGGH